MQASQVGAGKFPPPSTHTHSPCREIGCYGGEKEARIFCRPRGKGFKFLAEATTHTSYAMRSISLLLSRPGC